MTIYRLTDKTALSNTVGCMNLADISSKNIRYILQIQSFIEGNVLASTQMDYVRSYTVYEDRYTVLTCYMESGEEWRFVRANENNVSLYKYHRVIKTESVRIVNTEGVCLVYSYGLVLLVPRYSRVNECSGGIRLY
jgi:hypothetical protein